MQKAMSIVSAEHFVLAYEVLRGAPIEVLQRGYRLLAARGAAEQSDSNTPGESALGGTNSERREMIAVAAYFLAERRGFAPGGDVEDWIAAEREIEALLSTGADRQWAQS
ncbi:MAG TPA: DUF2934 domain-containing protein [Burkholderiales bacterium]|nr:DUF2934 domain-containing protein [Burkholderiales bacterium]